jgi:O-antigen/teichoic acid export membrane protein
VRRLPESPHHVAKNIRLLRNIVGSFLTRAVNLGAAAIVVPLAVKSLGTGDYGLFAVILSAVTFFAVADLGLGLALVNPVALAESQKQTGKARALISQIWFFLLVVAGALFVAGSGTILAMHWRGAGALADWSTAQIWLLVMALVCAGLPAGLTQRVLFALDRNYEASLWQTGGRVLAVLGSVVAYVLRLGMHGFILAALALPLLAGWISTAWLYLYSRPDLAPTRTQFSLGAVARNIPSGLRYLLLQLAQLAELSLDVILVGSFLGAHQVAAFDLVTRLFNYIPALAAIGIMPLWPAIAGAVARGEEAWVSKVECLSLLIVLLVALLPAAALVLSASSVVHLWTGATVRYPISLTTVLGLTAVLSSVGSLQASVIMARDGEKRLCHIQLVLLLLLVSLKLLALPLLGIVGLVSVTAVLYAPRLLLYSRILREYGTRISPAETFRHLRVGWHWARNLRLQNLRG